jgi:hypothetical protein
MTTPVSVPVTTITRSGTTWPATDGQAADAVNGNIIPNGPHVCVLVFNGAGTPSTVSFNTPYTASGLAIAEDVKTIPAGGRVAYGPFPVSLYGG